MNDLEKEVVREKKYEENRRKMDIVKRNLMISRIYNVYVNLAVTLISAASMYIWVSYTSAGIKMVHIGSRNYLIPVVRRNIFYCSHIAYPELCFRCFLDTKAVKDISGRLYSAVHFYCSGDIPEV